MAVVVTTGDNTEIGRISHLIATAETLHTPLTRKMAQFSRMLIRVILGFAALTFFVGILRGQNWVEMFMANVALLVAAFRRAGRPH
jgi:Ca2+-transporting ATPase